MVDFCRFAYLSVSSVEYMIRSTHTDMHQTGFVGRADIQPENALSNFVYDTGVFDVYGTGVYRCVRTGIHNQYMHIVGARQNCTDSLLQSQGSLYPAMKQITVQVNDSHY